MKPRAGTRFQRLLLETKYLRILGRRLLPAYTTTLDDGTRIKLRLDSPDYDVLKEIFERKPYEKYFKPSSGTVVVDAGANSGCFTVRAALLVGEGGRILAFEPSTSNFKLLQENVSLNHLTNVTLFHCGLGESEGEATLNLYDDPGGNTFLPARDEDGERMSAIGKERTKLRTIDGVVSELGVDRVDLLKIDTEGFELPILKGAQKVIRSYHPRIVGEAHSEFSEGGDAILEFLKRLGYEGKVEAYHENLQLFFAWVE